MRYQNRSQPVVQRLQAQLRQLVITEMTAKAAIDRLDEEIAQLAALRRELERRYFGIRTQDINKKKKRASVNKQYKMIKKAESALRREMRELRGMDKCDAELTKRMAKTYKHRDSYYQAILNLNPYDSDPYVKMEDDEDDDEPLPFSSPRYY